MELREVTYLAVILRICAAFILGGILGLERGIKQRPAGLRTYMLVCVGACMIMLTNQYIFQTFGTGDPVRMGAQVVSGIGFLGAGTIMVTKHSQIKGLTTAAGLWSAAAVGLATGIGFYEAAVVGAVAIFVILTVLTHLDARIHRKTRHFDVYAQLSVGVGLGVLLEAMRSKDILVDDVQMEQGSGMDGSKCFVMMISTKKRMERAQVTALLMDLPEGMQVEIF